MTTREEIETKLLRAVEVTPSADGLRWLDQRVVRAMAASPAMDRRGLFTRRVLLRPLALVAAFVLLTGAVGAAINLIDRLVDESTPGWRTAWERAEILWIRQTNAGLTLTLERAYVDLNQVVLGIAVEGLDAPPTPIGGDNVDHILSWVTELRGPDGWAPDPARPNSSGRVIETDLSAFLLTFDAPPAVAGAWELTVTSVGYGATPDGMVDGIWRFEFELPQPEGTVLSVNSTDTVDGATLSLSELRVTPTAIGARIALNVAGETVAYWSPGTGLKDAVRHGGSSYEIAEETLFATTPDVNEYRTSAGSMEVAGTWEIEIPDLWYTNDAGQNIHAIGPWTLTVNVP
jgi:hypothetical protein